MTGKYDFNLSWIWRSGSPSPATGSADISLVCIASGLPTSTRDAQVVASLAVWALVVNVPNRGLQAGFIRSDLLERLYLPKFGAVVYGWRVTQRQEWLRIGH